MSASNTTSAFDRRRLLKSAAVAAALSAPATARAQPQRATPMVYHDFWTAAYQAIDD